MAWAEGGNYGKDPLQKFYKVNRADGGCVERFPWRMAPCPGCSAWRGVAWCSVAFVDEVILGTHLKKTQDENNILIIINLLYVLNVFLRLKIKKARRCRRAKVPCYFFICRHLSGGRYRDTDYPPAV